MLKNNFPISGMMCASCALSVETALKNTPGVENVNVNFATKKALITYDNKKITTQQLKKIVKDAGYDLEIGTLSEEQIFQKEQKDLQSLKNDFLGSLFFSIPVFIISMFHIQFLYSDYLQVILTTLGLVFFGKRFFIGAYKQLKHRSANMDTLVALSVGVAYVYSLSNIFFSHFWLNHGIQPHLYFESAIVIISFILFGKFLEENAKGKTSDAIKQLMNLKPDTVFIKKNGDWQEVEANTIHIGDTILVKSGQKIAVDGEIITGNSTIDESMITGESLPVDKTIGDKVFAGTINQLGSFEMSAQKIGNQTLLASIIKAVEDAQGSKAPVQKIVDKIAKIFVPTIIGIAILSFIVWIIFSKENGFVYGLQSFVTVLVIACPCALGLATPTAIMVGIGKAATHGILMKDAESIEIAKKVDTIVFDKTGTITKGELQVGYDYWTDKEKYLPIFLGIEHQSNHPLAKAIVKHFEGETFQIVEHFSEIVGSGVSATFQGKKYTVGNKKFIESLSISFSEKVSEFVSGLPSYHTVIYFADEKNVLGVVSLSDEIKETSKQAIKNLIKKNIKVYMLTGDQQSTAHAIASQVGISHIQAEVLPTEKQNFIKNLKKSGNIVAMVGDGINDSQALAEADLGIAMGKGSDIAMEVAQVTIIASDLEKIASMITISKQTVATIYQNLFWAFIYNLIGIPVAAGILYPFFGFMLNPMIAGLAMALSSVSVVTNSLLLKYKK